MHIYYSYLYFTVKETMKNILKEEFIDLNVPVGVPKLENIRENECIANH